MRKNEVHKEDKYQYPSLKRKRMQKFFLKKNLLHMQSAEVLMHKLLKLL